jgi:hypothetical protein
MSERTDINIFIASSKELKAERDETNNILEKLNLNFPHLHRLLKTKQRSRSDIRFKIKMCLIKKPLQKCKGF